MNTHRQPPLRTSVRISIALAVAVVLVLAIYLVFDVPLVIAASFAVITGSAGAGLAYVVVRVFSTPGDHYGTAPVSHDEWRARLRENIDQIIADRSNAEPLPFDETAEEQARTAGIKVPADALGHLREDA